MFQLCEATEGRRFWFDQFAGERAPSACNAAGILLGPDGGDPMSITLGLMTGEHLGMDALHASVDARPQIPSAGSIGGSIVDNIATVDGGLGALPQNPRSTCQPGCFV